MTEQEVAKAEALIKDVVRPADLGIMVDNIGVDNGFSAVYTPNAAMHTGFIQVGLTPGHSVGSYAYIARIKRRLAQEMPELTTYFSTGSLVDAVVNMGAPAPIDIQISRAPICKVRQSGGPACIARKRCAPLRWRPTFLSRRIWTIRPCALTSTASMQRSSA